ncbi:MAG: NADH-quinone oxidoreductase subunit NuoN [Lautropia sp.]|nr:NADH-quinone oxidoreductase subunit NuoN [Lautropia sp.]
MAPAVLPQAFNLLALLPEIALLLAGCIVLLADATTKESAGWQIDRLALGVLLLPLAATLYVAADGHSYSFGDMYVSDLMAHTLKVCAIIATGVVIIYSRQYASDRAIRRGELYSLALFALLGQMVMISGSNLLVLYLGLELMSLSLYAVAALRRDVAASSEAAMKYFVLGALSSGFLLYGMSMVYGATGSLNIPDIVQSIAFGRVSESVLVFGLVFVVAGIAFKFGAVPFHMWIPDVYQGTATVATLLIAAGPKLAAFALAFRLLGEALMTVSGDWHQMLIVLAVLSLGLGNIVAIAQTNLKRMLAYSTISQVGFVLLGMIGAHTGGDAARSADAFGSSMFYAITNVLTTLGTFGLIQLLARKGFEAEEIDDFKGLARRSPWLAGIMMMMMFSLAGLPPLVGFYAKLVVLESVISVGLVWLAVYAVVMSLIGAYYYIRVIKVMYFDEAVDTSPIVVGNDVQATMAVNGLLILLLGIVPGPLVSLCAASVRQALQLG